MAKAPSPHEDDAPAGKPLTAEDYKTEQTKGAPDPVDDAQEFQKVELNKINPHEPPKTGKPWAEPKALTPQNQQTEEQIAAEAKAKASAKPKTAA